MTEQRKKLTPSGFFNEALEGKPITWLTWL